uniref:Protein-serine/threonine kinase n=1 Tax=Chromera velia CCMP2878 TaxID=1169474 RepID=A0A0G4GBL1_9ALVE|eukprot:Cvel_21156.t1-p1 / transcript=Cvel_21156.t1 / gene=Cvel_21156 / organism=Chromera_velia_CCMP2878 / gene_product=[Pyruvate dehydrogenase (acetyl-transferring)], putative / transcript_product=[Pyruvate dehydrogenase (acetyl-transferring)], putative / location=Cvel_scaffold1962:6157-10055(-) / protein_length=493 / sequence_SO=supercontig / SO=protein_coding / is_pseudo=false
MMPVGLHGPGDHSFFVNARMMDSQVADYAALKPRPQFFRSMLSVRDLPKAASFLRSELPRRLAARIQQIDSLSGYREVAELEETRDIYSQSFLELRLDDVLHGGMQQEADVSNFAHVLYAQQGRHAKIIPLVIAGMQKYRALQIAAGRRFSAAEMDRFLDLFVLNRIGSSFLREQWLVVHQSLRPNGMVDLQCDPVGVVQQCVGDAQELCRHHFGKAPNVDVVVRDPSRDLQMAYLPQYLYYIMFELLKNSLRAVVETHGHKTPQSPWNKRPSQQSPSSSSSAPKENEEYEGDPLVVSLSSGGQTVVYRPNLGGSVCSSTSERLKAAENGMPTVRIFVDHCPASIPDSSGASECLRIRVADCGGGIPKEVMPKIWRFGFTSAKPIDISPYASSSSSNGRGGETKNGCNGFSSSANGGGLDPLAGFGVGLPLARSYARYLGGLLEVQSEEGTGTTATLCIRTLNSEKSREILEEAQGWSHEEEDREIDVKAASR